MENQTNLKPMPFGCKKSQLVDMYISQWPESKIRKRINLIIEESRKNFQDTSTRDHNVTHCELIEYVDTYGLPPGYYEQNSWRNGNN